MAKSNNNSKRISEMILVVIIILSMGLIIVEMATNLSNEIAAQEERITTVEEVEPTLVPTLTAEEREDLFSAPVGEDGND